MKVERAMLQAEHQRQQQMLIAEAVPVVQQAIAQLQLGGSAAAVPVVRQAIAQLGESLTKIQGNNVRDEGQYASEMQRGVVDNTPEDAPPAYQDVQNKH